MNVKTYSLMCFVLMSAVSQAQGFEQAAEGYCEKLKFCAMEQVQGDQSLPEDLMPIVLGQVDSMCSNRKQNYLQVSKDYSLEKEAIACMNSFATLSCDSIDELGYSQSRECVSFRAAIAKR